MKKPSAQFFEGELSQQVETDDPAKYLALAIKFDRWARQLRFAADVMNPLLEIGEIDAWQRWLEDREHDWPPRQWN